MLGKRLLLVFVSFGALSAWGHVPDLCRLTMAELSGLLTAPKGLNTGMPRSELREILNPGGKLKFDSPNRVLDQYRNARDYVASLPKLRFADATVAVRVAHLEDLFLELYLGSADDGWVFSKYQTSDGHHIFEGPGQLHPVVIIRKTDGEVFKGFRPDTVDKKDWKPIFDNLDRVEPKTAKPVPAR